METTATDSSPDLAFPHLCAKTGAPTEAVIKQEFADVPGWTPLLIFWGLVPFLIARGFARRKVTLELPISDGTRRRIRLVDTFTALGLVLAAALLIIWAVLGKTEPAIGAASGRWSS